MSLAFELVYILANWLVKQDELDISSSFLRLPHEYIEQKCLVISKQVFGGLFAFTLDIKVILEV